MKRSSFLSKRRVQKEEIHLPITAMADIFTVILVFMLKTYATSAVTVELSESVNIPQAQGRIDRAEEQVLKLEVSKTSVAVSGKSVLRMNNFQFDKSDLAHAGSSKLLSHALSQERIKNIDLKESKKVLVVADQGAPYSTIKAVLASAALEGFTDIKLAVSDGQ